MGDSDDLWNGMFDLDGDGKTTEEEEMLGMYALQHMMDEDDPQNYAQPSTMSDKTKNIIFGILIGLLVIFILYCEL